MGTTPPASIGSSKSRRQPPPACRIPWEPWAAVTASRAGRARKQPTAVRELCGQEEVGVAGNAASRNGALGTGRAAQQQREGSRASPSELREVCEERARRIPGQVDHRRERGVNVARAAGTGADSASLS